MKLIKITNNDTGGYKELLLNENQIVSLCKEQARTGYCILINYSTGDQDLITVGGEYQRNQVYEKLQNILNVEKHTIKV